MSDKNPTRAEKLAALRNALKEAAHEARAEREGGPGYRVQASRTDPFDSFEKPQRDHRDNLAKLIQETDAAELLDEFVPRQEQAQESVNAMLEQFLKVKGEIEQMIEEKLAEVRFKPIELGDATVDALTKALRPEVKAPVTPRPYPFGRTPRADGGLAAGGLL